MAAESADSLAKVESLYQTLDTHPFHLIALDKVYPKQVATVTRQPENAGEQGLAPAAVEAELSYYNELFEKLKFNYLEQATKERFIRDLMQEPPLVVDQEDIQELEASNVEHKQRLKQRKGEMQRYSEKLSSLAHDVVAAYCQTKDDFTTTPDLLREIRDLESQIQRIEAEDDSTQKLTIQESQMKLNEQLAHLATVSTEIDEHKARLAALNQAIQKHQDQVHSLESECKSASYFANEAQRLAQTQSPQIQSLYQWYKDARETLMGLFGIRQVQYLDARCTRLVYDCKGPHGQTVTLDITLTPDGAQIESLDLTGAVLPDLSSMMAQANKASEFNGIIASVSRRIMASFDHDL
ncbi:hypothetical protein H4R34_001278 [Dimargaris verticillata]|uniref:Kinetochore protein Sos7 coiled-coil domain-containing protein n=1 Tax=Dimargaris verticillata TaxID=2761393 RepID=A0A9W8BB34_9FUNG|nr:hypothetical protein H4R34_001278 [Dimargaris verticillata]